MGGLQVTSTGSVIFTKSILRTRQHIDALWLDGCLSGRNCEAQSESTYIKPMPIRLQTAIFFSIDIRTDHNKTIGKAVQIKSVNIALAKIAQVSFLFHEEEKFRGLEPPCTYPTGMSLFNGQRVPWAWLSHKILTGLQLKTNTNSEATFTTTSRPMTTYKK